MSMPPLLNAIARRRFLKWATAALSLVGGLLLAIPFLGTLISPVFNKPQSQWVKVGAIDDLQVNQPVDMTFADQVSDAYIQQTVLHSIWAVKLDSGDPNVYSPICPHLGCQYDWDAQANQFHCPCHGSVFALDGKVLGGPAPRPLDTLPTKIEDGMLHVQWEQFKVGVPEKVQI